MTKSMVVEKAVVPDDVADVDKAARAARGGAASAAMFPGTGRVAAAAAAAV